LADLDLTIIEPDGSVASREFCGNRCLLDVREEKDFLYELASR